jgi:peptide-O-fucosyltransferase
MKIFLKCLKYFIYFCHRFPASSYPVLALKGAPARYPVTENNRHIQRYLKWSPNLLEQADKLINQSLPKGPFIGIHLRNGLDWVSDNARIPLHS